MRHRVKKTLDSCFLSIVLKVLLFVKRLIYYSGSVRNRKLDYLMMNFLPFWMLMPLVGLLRRWPGRVKSVRIFFC